MSSFVGLCLQLIGRLVHRHRALKIQRIGREMEDMRRTGSALQIQLLGADDV